MANYTVAEVEQAKARLFELAPKGTRIYGIIRHVAPSGMSRVIDLLTITPGTNDDGELIIRTLSYNAARVLGLKLSEKHGGVIVHGCGMDMLFWAVDALASRLYDDGQALKYRRL